MNNKLENKIQRSIIQILDRFVQLYDGENVFTHYYNDSIEKLNKFHQYVYYYSTPNNKKKKFIFLIPKNENIKFSVDKDNHYTIDIFNQFQKNKNAITPELFYNFLFNIDNYKIFLDSDIEFKNVNRLYIDRDIKILVNEDKINSDSKKQSNNVLDEWLNRDFINPVLLLGDRGMGKSWVVKNFCLKQIEKHNNNPWIEPAPIYLNLKVFSDSFHFKTSLFEAIIFQIRKIYGIKMLSDYYIWETFVSTGKVIIVLDGLDEMSKEIDYDLKYRHLWEIFNIADKTSKLIITSRTSYFSSLNDLYKNFSYKKFKEKYNSEDDRVFSDIESKFNRNFNIWTLKRLSRTEIESISKKYTTSKSNKLLKGIDVFKKLIQSEKSRGIVSELEELSHTPAFFQKIVYLSTLPNLSVIEIYKKCLLDAAIEYNITSNRALKVINVIEEDELELISFNKQKKLEILQELSWFMFERNQSEFELDKLPNYIKSIFGYNDEIIINDIRTQTLIKLKDNNEFKFFSNGIFAFLIASHLKEKLNNCIDEGIIDLGNYHILSHPIGERIIIFLKEFVNKDKNLKEKLLKIIYESLVENKSFASWHRYLVKNVKNIYSFEIINELNDLNSWSKIKLTFKDNLAIVTGNKSTIDPFLLSKTEVTNEQFNLFINNKVNKKCLPIVGYYWKRKLNNNTKDDNPFVNVINDYHLYYWENGKMPKNIKKHPVVYISWFAAAAYCNWLSIQENIDTYYNFIFNEDGLLKEVEINSNSYGYRLPTIEEWTFAAKEGDNNYKYPWDKFKDKETVEKIKNDLLKRQELTSEVKDGKANIFGIYGMMGNVREWVNSEESVIGIKSECKIKGATWLLGEKGFKFEHMNKIMAQNTNLDVGFRVAKSFDPKISNEIKKIFFNNKKGKL